MARSLTLPAHHPRAALEARSRRARDPVARSHWQIVWLWADGLATAEVARVTGSSPTWVREIAHRDAAAGPDGLGDRRHGNPGAAPLLPPVQHVDLRAALAGPAPAGGMWTCRQVAAWMAAVLGRPMAEVRGWEWMRRLGLTPQRPRPRATRADPDAQTAFTKGGFNPRSMPSPPTTPPPP